MNDPDTPTRTCATRWRANKDGRITDLRKLFCAYHKGDEEKYANELGTFSEYGLAFDYVAPGTFKDQDQGYWRYQLSWGGPSDEFRFYAGGCGEQMPHRISYIFLDWFDGHERALVGHDLQLMRQIWLFFSEAGSTRSAYREGIEPSER
jgi:hypothetical protein